jgi:hypothetical protein
MASASILIVLVAQDFVFYESQKDRVDFILNPLSMRKHDEMIPEDAHKCTGAFSSL